jgi:hypothetical protein
VRITDHAENVNNSDLNYLHHLVGSFFYFRLHASHNVKCFTSSFSQLQIISFEFYLLP